MHRGVKDAGYAADGYARVKGVACVCVTFTVRVIHRLCRMLKT